MENKVGKCFKQARIARGLSPQGLAGLVGYKNANRGANRILAFENSGVGHRDLIEKLIAALELDRGRLRELAEEDRHDYLEAWEEWASQPVEPQLVFRAPGPCIWFGKELPEGLTKVEAIEFVKGLVALPDHRGWTFVLKWNRREEIWFYPGGGLSERTVEADDVTGAFNTLGNGRSPFVFEESV